MNNLLNEVLNKKGVQDVSELEEYEKQDFERWNRILSEGEVTVDKIKQFCETQIKIIESKWKDLESSRDKNDKLIVMHVVYKTLIELIEAPSVEKENLERYLQSLIK